MNTLRYAISSGAGGATAGRRQIEDTPRKKFLRYSGLQRDVFANPVAEQEYSFSSRPDPVVHPYDQQARDATQLPLKPTFSALSYFVDPLYNDRRQGSIFADLRRPEHTFLFGRPGEGKTTTRLALEAHVRTEPRETLMVTYEPGRFGPALTLDDHLSRLVCEVAVDLFVQVMEQFAYRSRLPGKRQTEGLLWLLPFGGPALLRVLDRLAHGDEPSRIWGFAELWRYLDRPIVRPVVRTERLRSWLQSLHRNLATAETEPPLSPNDRWRRAVDIVHRWGFRRLYVAVDGVDTWQRTTDEMMAVLDGLLNYAPQLARQGVFLRGFLPLQLREAVERTLAAGKLKPDAWRFVTLNWREERLTALLCARLLAGGTPALSMADLFETEFTPEIDDALIASADKSPRRLLTSIDQLINVHIRRGQLERHITTEEWDEAQRRTKKLLVF